jgi:hypothetical protein
VATQLVASRLVLIIELVSYWSTDLLFIMFYVLCNGILTLPVSQVRIRLEERQAKNAVNTWLIITITLLDIIHRPVLYLNTQHYRYWLLSPRLGGTYSDRPNRKS